MPTLTHDFCMHSITVYVHWLYSTSLSEFQPGFFRIRRCRKSYTRRQKNTSSGATHPGGCLFSLGYSSCCGTTRQGSLTPSSNRRTHLRYLRQMTGILVCNKNRTYLTVVTVKRREVNMAYAEICPAWQHQIFSAWPSQNSASAHFSLF